MTIYHDRDVSIRIDVEEYGLEDVKSPGLINPEDVPSGNIKFSMKQYDPDKETWYQIWTEMTKEELRTIATSILSIAGGIE